MQKFLRTLMLVALMLPFASQAQCDAITAFPWTENFEAMDANTVPTCWDNTASGSSTLTSNPERIWGVYSYSGNKMIRMYNYYVQSGTALINTPTFDLPAGESYDLTFSYSHRASCGAFSVKVSTDNGTTFTELQSYTSTGSNDYTNPGEFTEAEISLAAYAGQSIILQFFSTANYGSGAIFVDDIHIGAPATCFKVTDLAIDATATTATSLTLTWTDARNTDATYSIYNGETVVASNVSGTTYTVTGLDANTYYTFGVMTDCGDGDVTDMVYVSGRTACAAIATLPYTMGFEDADLQGTTSALLFPFCWTRINTSTSTSYNYYPYAYNYGTPHDGGRHLYFYAYSYGSYADTTGFVMPELDVTTYPMNGNRVTFWAKASSSSYPFTVRVGTMTDPTDRSTFTLAESVNVAATSYTKYTVSLASATATDAYVAFIVPKVGSTMYIDDVTLEELPSCGDIASVQIASTSTESITLRWTAVAGANGYTIYDMADNSVLGTTTDTTYTVDDLEPNTAYTLGVQSNCSGGDGLIATVSGRTACVAITIDADNLFSESFEGTAFPPDCWSTAHTDIASGRTDVWQRQTSTSDVHTGSASAKLPDMQTGNKANLVTPLFDIDEANAYMISFWMKRVSSTKPNEGVKVWVNTTPDTIGGTPLMHIRRGFAMGEITETEAGWYKYSAAIPTSGEVYIIFEGISEYGNYSSIDDIAIEVAPSCLPVSDLAVSNIGTDGATLTWSGDADGYTIYDMRDTSVYQFATDNTVVLYALDPATQYTFGVAANCGGDESDTMLISFRTLCAVVVVDEDNTFRETFNSLTAGIPACWDNSEGTTTSDSYKWSYFATGHDGAGLRFDSYYNSSSNTNFLATPPIQLDIDARLSFWYKNPTAGDFSVLVSTDGGTTRTTIASGLTGASDWTLFTYDFDADTYTGDTVIVYFKGTSNYGSGDAYIYLDDVTVGQQPSCLAVTDLTVVATETTSESITLSWVSDGSNFTVLNMADTTEIGSTTDTFMVVNNLTPVTTYTFGVVVDCGSETSDTMYISARTACAPFNAPYTWGFEDMTANNAPECWNAVSGTPYVTGNTSYSTYSHSGDKALAFYGTGLIVLPELTVEANTLQMQLWLRAGSNTSSSGNFEVGYMTNPADATTFTAIATYNYSEFAINGTMTYDMRSVMFANAPEGARMALRAAPTSSYIYWYVDDVTIDELPSCVPVTNLAAVADQTTTESITISWVSDASSFTVLDMADSSVIGTTTDTFMVVNNLEASSLYTFGVVVNCSGETSDTITVEARTACSAFALPYTEDFENGIDCWSLESCASGTKVVEGASYAYTGTHAFKFNYNTNPPQYLISPELTGGEDGVQVSLMYKVGGSYTESFALGYSTTTNETSAFTWLSEQTGLTNQTYEAYTDYLPAGTKYVAVKYTANDQLSLYIDSMAISPMSANFCFPVAGLAVNTATANSVTISWTGDAASYSIYNGTAYVGSTADTFYTVSGLTASTAYTFGVQAICSATDSADMVTISAMTDCEGGSCTITIVGTDEYGDGWDNSYIDIQQNGASVGQCTVEGDPWAYDDPYPVTETYTYTVCAGVPVTFTWVNGGANYDDEASFIIKNGNDSVLYTASDASELTAGSVFYTANNVCGSDEPQPHPQVEEATIAASAVTYWVGTGSNQVVMAVNWADTALAWGVNFSTDSITSQAALDTIAANDPRFSWTTGSYGLGNITFTENGTTLTGDANHFWESKRNTISDMGLSQNLGNSDFQKWANSAAGVVVDSMEYSGVWYYMHNYPMTIYPVTAPQPGPQPADSIVVTFATNDATLGTTTPAPGTYTYHAGDTIRFSANATTGNSFVEWVIDFGDGTTDTLDAQYTAAAFLASTMMGYGITNMTLTANFQAGVTAPDSIVVTFATNDATLGTTTPAPGTYTYHAGDTIRFSANATTGNSFAAWIINYSDGSADTVGSQYQSGYYFLASTMIGYGITSMTMTAYFQEGVPTPDSIEVTYAVNDSTMGSITPNGTVMTAVGDSIAATATANAGYELYGWRFTVYENGEVARDTTLAIVETSVNFGALPQFYADANATVTITAMFQQQVGIEDADISNVNVYSANSTIYVRGAEGQSVYVFDVNGRMLNHEAKASENCSFRMENTGVYLVKVGNAAAQRVIVVR